MRVATAIVLVPPFSVFRSSVVCMRQVPVPGTRYPATCVPTRGQPCKDCQRKRAAWIVVCMLARGGSRSHMYLIVRIVQGTPAQCIPYTYPRGDIQAHRLLLVGSYRRISDVPKPGAVKNVRNVSCPCIVLCRSLQALHQVPVDAHIGFSSAGTHH